MKRTAIFFLLSALLAAGLSACGHKVKVTPEAFRGVPKEQLQEQREAILSRHADGSALSERETAEVEALRDQERRLEHSWIFGEWQERHGARIIFRDDGTVSVGARSGYYDEVGIYKYISPEVHSFESVWTVHYDAEGNPVAMVKRPTGDYYLYPFHDSNKSVYEQEGDLQVSLGTGCYFQKIQY